MEWKSERRKIEDLKPAKYNPRKISEKAKTDLDNSITAFNLVDPLIINFDGTLIGGHQRLTILKEKGILEVDVRVPDQQLPEHQEKELNLRLNRVFGEFDLDLLMTFDPAMLENVGFESDELDKIFKVKDNENDDVVPDNPPGICHRGDIYKLGEHRLMCGDSISAEDVTLLMGGGGVAAMIHTDPPYNVDYGVSKNPRHKIRTIENDKQSPEDWEVFCKKLFEIFKTFNNGDIYMWGASAPEGMRMRLWLTEAGCHWSATIIWKKQQLVLTPANYQRIYEPCFYGWFNKSSFGDDRKQTEVWEIDRPHNSKLHPTMKPIELCERAILNSSKRNDIVLDLFLGSGSTLIACEKTNRICYGKTLGRVYR